MFIVGIRDNSVLRHCSQHRDVFLPSPYLCSTLYPHRFYNKSPKQYETEFVVFVSLGANPQSLHVYRTT